MSAIKSIHNKEQLEKISKKYPYLVVFMYDYGANKRGDIFSAHVSMKGAEKSSRLLPNNLGIYLTSEVLARFGHE